MLRVSVTFNQELVRKLKDLPPNVKRKFKTKLRTELRPELEDSANNLLNQTPGPVSEPFIFGTTKSRRYYIILVRNNPELSDGQHWNRTFEIQEAFRIQIHDYVRTDMISLVNIQRQSTGTEPYPARFVYEPSATPGHINTGWFGLLENAKPILSKQAVQGALRLANEALREAGKEALS